MANGGSAALSAVSSPSDTSAGTAHPSAPKLSSDTVRNDAGYNEQASCRPGAMCAAGQGQRSAVHNGTRGGLAGPSGRQPCQLVTGGVTQKAEDSRADCEAFGMEEARRAQPYAAELAEVVRWCRQRIDWEQLHLHLQVRDIGNVELLVPNLPTVGNRCVKALMWC